MKYNLNFVNYFKKFNLISIFLVLVSLIFIIFKGLNYGIDFKGGSLIEIRLENKNTKTSDIRDALSNLDLGDINVKNFGDNNDYLIKIEEKLNNKTSLITKIKSTFNEKLNEEINYRRIEFSKGRIRLNSKNYNFEEKIWRRIEYPAQFPYYEALYPHLKKNGLISKKFR